MKDRYELEEFWVYQEYVDFGYGIVEGIHLFMTMLMSNSLVPGE